MANLNTTFSSTTNRPPAPQGRRRRPFVRTPNSRIQVKSKSSDHVPLNAVQECAVLDCHHKLLYPKHNFEECQCSGRGWQLNSNGGRSPGCTDKFKLVQSTLVPGDPFRKLPKPQGYEEQDQTRNKSITSSFSAFHLRSEGQ